MGYCIDLVDGSLTIKKANQAACLEAIKKLGNGANDPRAGGGSSDGKRWFSGMNNVNFDKCETLEKALEEWRFAAQFDGSGDLVGLCFDGEKVGDEAYLFEVIAPFVEPGSVLEWRGEDGAMWRHLFDGKTVVEQTPKITWGS